jgi:anti-sigma B factor antagonist
VVAPINRIDVERVDDSLAVVSVAGEHDLSSAPELREQLETLLAAGTAMVVDLTEATFVDSSVLAALIEASRNGDGSGVGFSVVLPPDAASGVVKVIEVTGIANVLAVRTTRDDAIEVARSGAQA